MMFGYRGDMQVGKLGHSCEEMLSQWILCHETKTSIHQWSGEVDHQGERQPMIFEMKLWNEKEGIMPVDFEKYSTNWKSDVDEAALRRQLAFPFFVGERGEDLPSILL